MMALKLPGQVYDEGNFFPKEDSTDSQDHDLPRWDAELTKRPKRVARRNGGTLWVIASRIYDMEYLLYRISTVYIYININK